MAPARSKISSNPKQRQVYKFEGVMMDGQSRQRFFLTAGGKILVIKIPVSVWTRPDGLNIALSLY